MNDAATAAADPPQPAAPPRPSPAAPPPQAPRVRLGEELPLFCERCGYSLHGLPQVRCGQCNLLHFTCPECNHSQHINTLRPAVQRFFGKIKAAMLVFSVLFRLNWFGWLLIAWFAMGVEWSYEYHYDYTAMRTVVVTTPGPNAAAPAGPPRYTGPHLRGPELNYEILLAFGLFGLGFGMLSRMLLLRWRRGDVIGAVLAALVTAAVLLGATLQAASWRDRGRDVPPFSGGFWTAVVIGAAAVLLGAVVVWPIWVGLARLFLPRRTADALLDWQRGLSNRAAAA